MVVLIPLQSAILQTKHNIKIVIVIISLAFSLYEKSINSFRVFIYGFKFKINSFFSVHPQVFTTNLYMYLVSRCSKYFDCSLGCDPYYNQNILVSRTKVALWVMT